MSGGGENYDFCEYVYNPLMRQYQAMMRLMSMLRDSQSDCNDVQCFNEQDPSNPLTSLNAAGGAAGASSSLLTYLPVLFVWALFVFALFMFRPSSMRTSGETASKKPSRGSGSGGTSNHDQNRYSNFRDNHDDDDNSSVS